MWKIIGNFAAVLGLVGVSFNSLFGKAYESHIALAALIATCFFGLVYVYLRVRRWENSIYPKGYKPIATFVRYSTTDGKNIIHETFRQIQVKRTYLSEIEHRYKWTGSKKPIITSHLQALGAESLDESTGFNIRKVIFERPKFCNDTEVVHLRSSLDDSDEKSDTHVSLLVDLPTTIVQFRIELLHCAKPAHASMNAIVERKRGTVMRSEYERIAEVRFDMTSRSFEYLLKYPEPGYEYRIRWDRPPVPMPRTRGKKKAAASVAPPMAPANVTPLVQAA